MLNKGFNPYMLPPSDPILKPFVTDVWHKVTLKDVTACYPPLSMLIFRLFAWISATPVFFKFAITLFDLATIPFLVRLLKDRGISASNVLYYALNPLVLLFIAGEGHLDAIQVFCACAALYFFSSCRDRSGFFLLGCAIMSKYLAIVLLPFVINGKNWKKGYTLFIPVLAYLPFLGTGGHLLTSVVSLGTVTHYNDFLNSLLRFVFGAYAPWAGIGLLIIALLVIILVVPDMMKSIYLAIGSMLLLMPFLQPWYLLLITPFLAFFPSRAWIYLHFAMFFTFFSDMDPMAGGPRHIIWIMFLEYVPFFGLMIWDTLTHRPLSTNPIYQSVKKMCVIIPTCNESDNLPGTLKSIQGNASVSDIVVVDGHSSDNTRDIAKQFGVRVITAQRGRGHQIQAGIGLCDSDVMLILHADCRFKPGIPERVIEVLNGQPRYIGGAMGMGYSHASFKNRLLAWANNGRARWAGISFGDQCQFFRREAMEGMGGFPDQMLMEDVELSLRMKKAGPLCFIPGGVEVSKRRWEKVGFWQNVRTVLTLCLRYLVQRRIRLGEPGGQYYYQRYYQKASGE
ncbi:MAG: glycosyltransferase [Deltaproteobacteria bacterium]|nr:glycosyltransferase [Deltaproteobacteria bacterium]